ncbi:MAG: hypothetical protein ACRDDW_05630 [Candidatus Rhabdochlamydia sp.]
MPSKAETLTCRVDGLKTIYIRNESVCFDFETEEQLNQARNKVTAVYATMPPFKLFLHSKKPAFAFKIFFKPFGANMPISFILDTTTIMATETSPKKIVPIVNY